MLELAFAMAPPPEGGEGGGGGFLALLPPMIMMFAIFYFILIRPQQKKQAQTRKMLDALKEGDNVVTMSGIHGTIKKIKDDVVMLQIADNVRIKINRASIATMKSESAAGAEKGEIDPDDDEIKKYCKVLDLEELTSKNQLKKAYKKKAAEVRPDSNNGDPKAEAEFKKVEKAYNFLLEKMK